MNGRHGTTTKTNGKKQANQLILNGNAALKGQENTDGTEFRHSHSLLVSVVFLRIKQTAESH